MEEVGLRAPLAQHLAGRYTHTVETTASEAPVQDEQRKTWTGTPVARQRAMVEEIGLGIPAEPLFRSVVEPVSRKRTRKVGPGRFINSMPLESQVHARG